MELNGSSRHLKLDPLALDLYNYLLDNQTRLNIEESHIFYNFPLYKDSAGALVKAKLLLVSPNHGVLLFGISSVRKDQDVEEKLKLEENSVDEIFNQLYGRLIKNKKLKKDKKALLLESESVIYAPFITQTVEEIYIDTEVLRHKKDIEDFLGRGTYPQLSENIFTELIATIDGANGMIRHKVRTEALRADSKGNLANKIESAILSFDSYQKNGYMVPLDGAQRIRGLAGSGKTVVLAMKAALTHLEHPDAKILFTFYTKSLYQHIQRLITRFYRQFDDLDPDFDRLHIIHAWGGRSNPGAYYEACIAHQIDPITYPEANQAKGSKQAFDYICSKFTKDVENIRPIYDYAFIDEGQDFPASFIQMCSKITKKERIVWAYDDLQTIFQVAAPSPGDIFGYDQDGNVLTEIEEDLVLYKCYRNPREILICAHALGFGFYGPEIVQLLESKEHWEDIGYIVQKGNFIEGEEVLIERPEAHSLKIVSEEYSKEEIVKAFSFETFNEEIEFICQGVADDIQDGLRPDDILVIVVDDRSAKSYLKHIENRLSELGIQTNNMHADSYGIRDFQSEGCVTLSTVHKAKGNESYMVYVAGVDALFGPFSSIRDRNMLFTALTRAKGWVRVSGIGMAATQCQNEINKALKYFPNLKFKYPSIQQIKVMKRGLKEGDIKKLKAERLLDQLIAEMPAEEIKKHIEQRQIKKGP